MSVAKHPISDPAIQMLAQIVHGADDHTFREPGNVGVWTEADSVTYFDDLRAESLGS